MISTFSFESLATVICSFATMTLPSPPAVRRVLNAEGAIRVDFGTDRS
jgi:hypothetical protein